MVDKVQGLVLLLVLVSVLVLVLEMKERVLQKHWNDLQQNQHSLDALIIEGGCGVAHVAIGSISSSSSRGCRDTAV